MKAITKFYAVGVRYNPKLGSYRYKLTTGTRRIRRGYMAVSRDFRRMLNAYRKRFCASKIHIWTYWTEA